MKLESISKFELGAHVGYTHSANVRLKDRDGMLFVTSSGGGVDPHEELFEIKQIRPVRLVMFDMDGTKLWERQLTDGVFPGVWFCPAITFDMDGDGVDEIYFVNNTSDAPLSFVCRRLERIDAMTGKITGTWPWPKNTLTERIWCCYRFYLVAGYAHGEPVLVTCQGTYGNMYLQGWNKDMGKRWEIVIKDTDPGPRASHVTPVLDINDDGVDELFWGERILSFDDGHEVIDLAPNFSGHSDVVIPYKNLETGEWYIFTCREEEQPGEKRILVFRIDGSVVWSALDAGHMHTAWAANTKDNYGKIIMCKKNSCLSGELGPGDPGETFEDFFFDAYTGEKVDFLLPYNGYDVLPLDLDGDGYHEFLCPGGKILNRHGELLAAFEGRVMRMGRLANHPGEQFMVANGTVVEIYADTEAQDGEIMKMRYEGSFLTFMQKLMASGYNCEGAQVSCGV